MNAKTIRKTLKAKIENWCESIDDPTVVETIKNGTIVTGGSIASMLLNESVNDYDIYFKDLATTEKVAEYYINKYREDQEKKEDKNDMPKVDLIVKVDPKVKVNPKVKVVLSTEDDKYRPVFLSSNAITLSDKIQIVLRFFGTPDEIHNNYDFAHCTSYWSSWNNKLVLRPEAMEALLAKELRYQGSLYPLSSIIRTRKFIKRGFTINAGQYLKMCMQLNDLDLKDLEVLKDQLTGVDVEYFQQVIKYIQESKKGITTSYVIEIIDRIFWH